MSNCSEQSASPAALLTKVERSSAKPSQKQSLVFDDNIPLPSTNQSNMEAELRRLWGHPGPKVMRLMLLQSGTQRHRRLAKKVYELNPTCNFCLEGSSQAASHTRDELQPTSKATKPRQRACSDCTGIHNIVTLGGARIAFIIVDQYCKYCWLWMIESTPHVPGIIRFWLMTIIKQKRHLKIDPTKAYAYLRSDNGPDFPQKFTNMLSKEFGIEHERTAAKASQQNADSESWICVLKKKCRTNLAFARAPRPWYGESYMHSWLCNPQSHNARGK